MLEYSVRPVRQNEVDKVADLLSTGYYDDKFFKWSVDDDEKRFKIVADYYRTYLRTAGCMAYVAEKPDKSLIGATVWLPHDTDPGTYDEINKVAGEFAPQFQAVGHKSHLSEPPMQPFYQLVGFVTLREYQKKGVGGAMLKYQLDKLDERGIPTYLEASTPYFGGGAYGKFGYQPIGELIVFTETAVLYPLWRPVKSGLLENEMVHLNHSNATGRTNPDPMVNGCDQASSYFSSKINFGGHDFLVLDETDQGLFLISEKVIELTKYHDEYENVTWAASSIRKYLNQNFINSFNQLEQAQIIETYVKSSNNPWYGTCGGDSTTDKIFLLSIEETVRYFGDSGQLTKPCIKFFIDDGFNENRRTTYNAGSPSKWLLRTPGSLQNFVANVTTEGKIAITGDFVNLESSELFNVGIRPAMWIKKD